MSEGESFKSMEPFVCEGGLFVAVLCQPGSVFARHVVRGGEHFMAIPPTSKSWALRFATSLSRDADVDITLNSKKNGVFFRRVRLCHGKDTDVQFKLKEDVGVQGVCVCIHFRPRSWKSVCNPFRMMVEGSSSPIRDQDVDALFETKLKFEIMHANAETIAAAAAAATATGTALSCSSS